MTQSERVLRALRASGPIGITQGDFLPPNVIDDGPKITRVGARIKDLKDTGYTIASGGTRDGFAVYVIEEVPTPELTSSQGPDGRPDWWPKAAAPPATNALFN